MKKIGIREIANLAGVSPGTVDRALHGRKGITEETRQRIVALAESVGYTPDLAARALSVGRVPVRIGASIPREIHHYFDQLVAGLSEEARRFEKLGVEVLYAPPERLGTGHVEKATELLGQHVDLLILTPGDLAGLTPIIDEAEGKGIRVICVDTDAPLSKRSTVVSVDAEVCGRLAAELMAGFLPPSSDVVVITGMLDVEDHARKTEGFRQMYESIAGGRTLEVIETHEDEEEGFQKSFALLSKNPSVAGLYVNTSNCLPVCRAICAAGLAQKIRLITTDLFEADDPVLREGGHLGFNRWTPIYPGRNCHAPGTGSHHKPQPASSGSVRLSPDRAALQRSIAERAIVYRAVSAASFAERPGRCLGRPYIR